LENLDDDDVGLGKNWRIYISASAAGSVIVSWNSINKVAELPWKEKGICERKINELETNITKMSEFI